MFEVVAANALATALCPAFTAGVNLVRATFLDPGVRELYVDWDTVAREAVAGLRATAGAETGNPRLADLVTELTDASTHFRQLWNLHEVFPRVAAQRLMHTPRRHQVLGRLQRSRCLSSPVSPPQAIAIAPAV